MRPWGGLDQCALLDLADAGRSLGPAGREIALIDAFCPDLDGAAADLDVGTAQARLLDLCEAEVGPELVAGLRCRSCDDGLEVRFAVDAVRQPASPGADALLTVRHGDAVARVRMPRGTDLLAIEALTDADAARRVLLDRCIVELDGVDRVQADLLDAIAAAMAAAMPQADVELAGACERCGEPWTAGLDAGLFLWSDVERRAERLAEEVHLLAVTYHWSEAEILALTPVRRRRYLDRVAS